MQRVYLDHNATTPLRPQVREAMLSAWDVSGNPSSVHHEGRLARGLIETARSRVADLVKADARNVIFTSGASEANMLALCPDMKDAYEPVPANRLFVSAIEHPSVLSGGRYAADMQERLPVNHEGLVDLSALQALLASHDAHSGCAMVAVMAVNSETGVCQPIEEIGQIAAQHGAYFHVDAVQAAGRIPLDIQAIGCSSLSLSAHKIGGPKGVGALVMAREGLEPSPLITGGPQENRLRAGTENVAGITGFGEAAKAAQADLLAGEMERLALLRDRFEARLSAFVPDIQIFGEGAPRVANTSQFAVPGLKGETVLIQLDLAGVAVSSGSACSSGKVSASHVLLAMGVDAALAGSAIRVSLGWNTQSDDIERLLAQLEKISMKNARKAS